MRSRYLGFAGALALVIVSGAVLAPAPLVGQASDGATTEAALRTPWGDPNLEGDWNGHSLTPLQRPTNYDDKPVLTPEEEAIIVAFRRYTLLPLDDCLYALQATIPRLTRSSLHRCFQRHGISRLPSI